MIWQEALEGLWAAWPSLKEKFQPVCYLIQADEPEFGCEARSETEPVFGRLLLLTPEGKKSIAIEEARLMQSGFYDKMWAGWEEDRPVLLCGGEKAFAREEDLIWLAAQLAK